jgi:hypothetical protein
VPQQPIETQRLIIRPFILEDLPVIHRILDQTFGNGTHINDPAALQVLAAKIKGHEWVRINGVGRHKKRPVWGLL